MRHKGMGARRWRRERGRNMKESENKSTIKYHLTRIDKGISKKRKKA